MSAPACIAYYGLRYELSPDEIDTLDTESEERVKAARRVGLRAYAANFGSPADEYLLFVGTELAVLGPENLPCAMMTSDAFSRIVEDTKQKLKAGGFEGEPRLYMQWYADV